MGESDPLPIVHELHELRAIGAGEVVRTSPRTSAQLRALAAEVVDGARPFVNEANLTRSIDVSQILKYALRLDGPCQPWRARLAGLPQRGGEDMPEVCLPERFVNGDWQVCRDERNARLGVVQSVAVPEKALVEEALSVLRRDDNSGFRNPCAPHGCHDAADGA